MKRLRVMRALTGLMAVGVACVVAGLPPPAYGQEPSPEQRAAFARPDAIPFPSDNPASS